MLRRPPRSTRTDTLFPYTTLFRSLPSIVCCGRPGGRAGRCRFGNRSSAIFQTFSRLVAAMTRPDHITAHPIVQCRSEEHTSELQSLMRISYAVFCLKKKKKHHTKAPTQQKYKYNN